jgi:hypothetical protein
MGVLSTIPGRSRDLLLSEACLVGPALATFIAALSVRYHISRTRIREFLAGWFGVTLSVGTLDRCIREVGVACEPVVENLLDDLRQAGVIHADETPWRQKEKRCWLWVVLSSTTAIFHIGSRQGDEIRDLIGDAFLGWLVSDGYGAYRKFKKRQRCLAHTIRTQSSQGLRRAIAPGWGISQRNDMADFQVVRVDDNTLDNELQNSLLFGKGRIMEAGSNARREGFQVREHFLDASLLLPKLTLLLLLLFQRAALLRDVLAPLQQFLQAESLGLIGIKQPPVGPFEAIKPRVQLSFCHIVPGHIGLRHKSLELSKQLVRIAQEIYNVIPYDCFNIIGLYARSRARRFPCRENAVLSRALICALVVS